MVQEGWVRVLFLIWRKHLCILFGVGHKSPKMVMLMEDVKIE